MKYKNLVFIVMLLLVLAGCIGMESIYLASAKLRLQKQVSARINQFLEQQQHLLLRLGKQLQPAIENQDHAYISKQLRTFEDQIFMLAKQGWTVPLRVQWVSLNVPQHIITSEGSGNKQLLAPSEDYYMQIVNTPQQLQLSATYTKHAMPEYNLQNLGMGLDDQTNMGGLLDATIPLDILTTYIIANIGNDAKYFTIKVVDMQQPSMIISTNHFWNTLLKLNACVLVIYSLLYWLVVWVVKIRVVWKSKCNELLLVKHKVNDLSHKLDLSQQATNTYMKYSNVIIDNETANKKCVNVGELLRDVQAINAESAMLRDITLNFTSYNEPQTLVTGNRTRLVQILSGILCQMLQQLPPSSTVEIQTSIINMQSNEHRVAFKFIDNGFYNELSTKTWDDIQQLVELEGGTLAHAHTAYIGNTISIEFAAALGNNIIHLDHYLTKV